MFSRGYILLGREWCEKDIENVDFVYDEFKNLIGKMRGICEIVG